MPKKEAKQPKCANCSGPHVASYKGCPEYKKQTFRQNVVNNQKSYAAVQSVSWSLAEFRHNKIVQLPRENCSTYVDNFKEK